MDKILVPVWMIVLGAYSSLADFTFTVLHDNDLHGKFEETTVKTTICPDLIRNYSCVGGFARAAHMIRKYRKMADEGTGPKVLYLSAGDVYVGSTWFMLHKGNIAAEMINLLKPDAMTLGNHEFDFGVEGLIPFVEKSTVPLISANINFKAAPQLEKVISKSTIIEIEGHKIGIIGCLSEKTNTISHPAPVIVLDELPAIKEESEKLHSKGVKIIILLSHVGIARDEELVKQLPLVDLVVGGHSHTFLYTGRPPDVDIPRGEYPVMVTQENGKRVPVVHAFAYCKYLGFLNVTFDDGGNLKSFQGKPIFLSNSVPQENDILNALAKYRSEVVAIDNKVVGMTSTLLDHKKCFNAECNIGNFAADAMVSLIASRSKSKFWTTHSIGVVNGGAFRVSIDPEHRQGNITQGDVIEACPFPNYLTKISLKGVHLKESVNCMFDKDFRSLGIMQVSGLKIDYNKHENGSEYVISAKARCSECRIPIYGKIDDEKVYNIVALDYYVDRYRYFNINYFNREPVNILLSDAIVWYLQTHSPIMQEGSGRLLFQNETSRGSLDAGGHDHDKCRWLTDTENVDQFIYNGIIG